MSAQVPTGQTRRPSRTHSSGMALERLSSSSSILTVRTEMWTAISPPPCRMPWWCSGPTSVISVQWHLFGNVIYWDTKGCTLVIVHFAAMSVLSSLLRLQTWRCTFARTLESGHTSAVCATAFRDVSYLKKHIRTHTNERPYTCSLCPMAFEQSDTLKGHLRTHTKERPYQCTLCPKAFTRSAILKRHLASHKKRAQP